METRGLIVLDAGHGETGNPHRPDPDRPCDYYEGTQNFRLAGFLKDALLKRGFSVVLTRERVTDDPTLESRGRTAGERGAVLFLSLHSNAPASSIPSEIYHSVRGAEVYYSLSDAEGNLPLAKALCDAVSAVMATPNRGVKVRAYPGKPDVDYYGVLRHSAASGCRRALLAEHGFHTNPEDAAFLQSDACLARLAEAEAEVIDRFFR